MEGPFLITADEVKDGYLIYYNHRQVKVVKRVSLDSFLCSELDDGEELRLCMRPEKVVRAWRPIRKPCGAWQESKVRYCQHSDIVTTPDTFYLVIRVVGENKYVCRRCDGIGYALDEHAVTLTLDPGADYKVWTPSAKISLHKPPL